MSKNNKDLKKLSLASMFFALCSVLVIFQIPVYSFLNLDFSLFALIIAVRFVGYRIAILIAIAFPWFAMLSYLPADFIACLILITLNLSTLFFDYLFREVTKVKNQWASGILTSISATLTVTLLNVLVFTPAYFNFDYEIVFQAFWYYFFMYLGFNFCKISLNYLLAITLSKGLKEQLNKIS